MRINAMNAETQAQLKTLSEKDAILINMSFGISESLGIAAINDSISSFIDFLKSRNGAFVPAFSLEYRVYLVGLIDKIDEAYKTIAAQNIILPKSRVS